VLEGAALRVSAPWLIAQMCRFKFSPERPPQSPGMGSSPVTEGLRFRVSLGEIAPGRRKDPTGSGTVTEVASHEDGEREKGHPGDGSFSQTLINY